MIWVRRVAVFFLVLAAVCIAALLVIDVLASVSWAQTTTTDSTVAETTTTVVPDTMTTAVSTTTTVPVSTTLVPDTTTTAADTTTTTAATTTTTTVPATTTTTADPLSGDFVSGPVAPWFLLIFGGTAGVITGRSLFPRGDTGA
ncbi:MAG TPA: hypothetical protein VHT30_01530 [Acidimicrobiales bacterium]|jgi:cytoskeletal protein RodZ|nr:hypothetical protein [Acidimicrobiales bacterium]